MAVNYSISHYYIYNSHASVFKSLLTFFTEHAVIERHLCKGFITLEGLAEYTAALYRKA